MGKWIPIAETRYGGYFQRSPVRPNAMTIMRLKHAAILLGMSTLLFMALRFLEQVLLARAFGTSRVLDVYFLAQIVLLVGAPCAVAVTSAAVPLITREMSVNGERAAYEKAREVFETVLGTCIVLGLLLWMISPLLASALSLRFDPTESAAYVRFLRLYIPAALLFVVAAAERAYWHARQELFVPGLVQLLLPVGTFVCAWLVSARQIGLAWVPAGAAIGSLAIVLCLAPRLMRRVVSKSGRSTKPRVSYRGRIEFLIAFVQVAVGIALAPVLVGITRGFGSRLEPGSVTALSLAASLTSIPAQLVASSLGTAILPKISSLQVDKSGQEAASLLERAIRVTLFIAIPVAILLGTVSDEIVATVFQGRQFSGTAVALTASALRGYSFGVPAIAVMQVLAFGFFALSEWGQVALSAILTLGINVVLALSLSRFSVFGVASAFSVACITNCVVLMCLFVKRDAHFRVSGVLAATIRMTLTAALAFLPCLVYRHHNAQSGLRLPFVLSIIVSGILYLMLGLYVCRFEWSQVFGLAVTRYLIRESRGHASAECR